MSSLVFGAIEGAAEWVAARLHVAWLGGAFRVLLTMDALFLLVLSLRWAAAAVVDLASKVIGAQITLLRRLSNPWAWLAVFAAYAVGFVLRHGAALGVTGPPGPPPHPPPTTS